MLMELYVENFGSLKKIQASFQGGFHVLTGASGSGKSLFLQALQLVSGARAQRLLPLQAPCLLEARFSLQESHGAWEYLENCGILAPGEERGELYLRRRLGGGERSRQWVQERPVSLATLEKLGGLLLEFCTQGQQHELLRSKEHSEL